MHLDFLNELVVIILVGVVVTVVGRLIRLPAAAGLLVAGVVVGPSGLRLVSEMERVEILAEIGVVLLLFTIGLEFSLARLRQIAKQVVVGGGLQVGLTVAATYAIAVAVGEPSSRALVYGFIVSLSSTAIVLRTLVERRELDSPHGRLIVGALIFQDLCVVPMMLVIPLLSADGSGGAIDIAIALGKASLVVVLAIVIARLVVPRLFTWVDRTRSREIFLLAVVAVCIGTAWITAAVGLSLALGAFLGGLVVADTEYGHRAMGDILPLRDVFMSVFFVSLGMLFDVRVLVDSPLLVLLLVLGFIAGKAVLATIAVIAMRFPARIAVVAAGGLAQFGEFGFVLANVADTSGVLPRADIRELFNAGIISMFLTPMLVGLAPRIGAGARVLRPLDKLLGARGIDELSPADEKRLEDHVIVVGYGVAGRLLSEALSKVGIPYVVLELNAETVRKASAEGVPIYYADVTTAEALDHAHVKSARAVVLLINDQRAATNAVGAIAAIAPDTPVLTRAHYVNDVPYLKTIGATDVVVEEVEAGLEMLARVLRRFDVPRNIIADHVDAGRGRTQPTERALTIPRKQLRDMPELDELKIEKILVRAEDFAAAKSPRELELRRRTGALVVAVRRHGTLRSDFDPSCPLEPGDELYLVGATRAVASAAAVIAGGAADAES